MTDKKENIVIKGSKAYGYNYASLSDIARQGFKIPKMKTGTENEKEYVYYFDPELNEWIRGAEVVIPEMKGTNAAQRYGASLSYAMRYSTILYLGLATTEDEEIETKESGIFDEPIGLKDLADEFRKLYPKEEQTRILLGLGYDKAEDIGINDLKKYINFKKYGKK